MPTQNVNLSEQQAKFIHERIENGQYGDASEVVQAGLRLLEQQQEEADKIKLATLRRLVKEGFDSIDRGDFVLVERADISKFISEIGDRTRPSKSR